MTGGAIGGHRGNRMVREGDGEILRFAQDDKGRQDDTIVIRMIRIEEQITMLDNTTYKISDFDYDLPQELIAQTPIEPRDASRLLVVHRDSGTFEHRCFRDIGAFLRPGDLLIANQSPAVRSGRSGHRSQ